MAPRPAARSDPAFPGPAVVDSALSELMPAHSDHHGTVGLWGPRPHGWPDSRGAWQRATHNQRIHGPPWDESGH
eukprot:4337181-Alexandrium_andersonii.AAC.1